uniref:Bm1338 n=1 Tax=Brugia malayi TaxID=6279 RepID=A0A1I9G2H0_BRUMA|nr:Bm1338 [Brugia malayi]
MKPAVVGVPIAVVTVVVGRQCDAPNELEFDPDNPAITVAVVPEVVAAAWAAANAAAFSGNIYLKKEC